MNILSSELEGFTIFQHRETKDFYCIETKVLIEKYFPKLGQSDLPDVEFDKLVLDPIKDEYVKSDKKEIINYSLLSPTSVEKIRNI